MGSQEHGQIEITTVARCFQLSVNTTNITYYRQEDKKHGKLSLFHQKSTENKSTKIFLLKELCYREIITDKEDCTKMGQSDNKTLNNQISNTQTTEQCSIKPLENVARQCSTQPLKNVATHLANAQA
jgi:hypothetical protein